MCEYLKIFIDTILLVVYKLSLNYPNLTKRQWKKFSINQ